MFIFARSRTSPAEVWEILGAPGVFDAAEKRFGPALQYRPEEPCYHVIGRLFVIPAEGRAEILLAFKQLTEAEQAVLSREVELHVGYHVWEGDDAPVAGYFMHATLYD